MPDTARFRSSQILSNTVTGGKIKEGRAVARGGTKRLDKVEYREMYTCMYPDVVRCIQIESDIVRYSYIISKD